MKAVIIGGGIGGLAAAVAVRKVGYEAEVYERAPEIREVGAGLSLWSNAVTALRRLGLEESVVIRAAPIRSVLTREMSGGLTVEFDMGDIHREVGAESVCAHRADLQQTLLAALPPECVHTAKECVGFAQDADGATARFADGSEARGNVLIGADGIRSVVRDGLFGAEEPRYAGYTCWRGIVPAEPPELANGRAEFHLGRGIQLGFFPVGGGRVYWFATRNAPRGTDAKPGPVLDRLLAGSGDWSPFARGLVGDTDPAAVFQNDIIDRPPRRRWVRGRVALLGDAAHPTTPNLGQGACQALEDAVILAERLRNEPSVESALAAYQKVRRGRANAVVRQSWRMGRMYQWQSRPLVWVRRWSLGLGFSRRMGERMLHDLLRAELPELAG